MTRYDTNDQKPIVIVDAAYSYRHLCEQIGQLQRKYPTLLEVDSIGNSVLGKQLYRLRLGNGPLKVHYNGSFHANEWITTILLMKFVEDLLKDSTDQQIRQGKDVLQLLSKVTLDVVPMVNPDGVDLVQEGLTSDHPCYAALLEYNKGSFNFIDWKANIRGVDLNDQFPANWEIERERRSPDSPGPRDYVGMSPMSEPEAVAMAAHTRQCGFDLVMAFHTQGEEIYWNYRGYEPPESKVIADQLAAVSGYQAIELTGSDAGYKDWFIQDFRKPGFTVECGFGRNPLPIEQFPSIYDKVSKLMLEGIAF